MPKRKGVSIEMEDWFPVVETPHPNVGYTDL
jgi:hypothetical protein